MIHDDGVVVSDSFIGEARWLQLMLYHNSYVSFCVVIHIRDQTRAPHIYGSHVDVNHHRDRDTHLRGTGRIRVLT